MNRARAEDSLSVRSPLLRGLEPFVPATSRILILGSMPSAASLEAGFYYAHPQNRFFRVIGAYAGRDLPDLISRQDALEHLGIALFDVIASCRRQGSLDSAIRDVTLNDISAFITEHPALTAIVTNGGLARHLFERHFLKTGLIPAKISVYALPSTSPANARFSLEALKCAYFEVFDAHLKL